MGTDNPDAYAIKGDVIVDGIRRISGEPGSDDGLIDIPLRRHDYRYRVRIDSSGSAPRLVELHLIPHSANAEIDPATIRQVPVRRLAKAAARFVSLTERGVALAGDFDNPTDLERPDHRDRKRRTLDDVHYREVARLLKAARAMGLPPRHYVGERLHATLPTVDRWIAEAKSRRYLARDWATASTDQQEASR